MERDQRRDDRRRREDPRDHRSRNDRDRSRSPPARERHDDRRRERSPPRGAPRGPGNRDRDPHRGRDRQPSGTPPPPTTSSRRPGGARQPLDARSNNTAPNGRTESKAETTRPDVRMQGGIEDEDSDAEMQRIMGFGGFRSTKNTKVPGNDKNYGVNKVKKTEYRQYMNRVGGFNRPLSPSRI